MPDTRTVERARPSLHRRREAPLRPSLKVLDRRAARSVDWQMAERMVKALGLELP